MTCDLRWVDYKCLQLFYKLSMKALLRPRELYLPPGGGLLYLLWIPLLEVITQCQTKLVTLCSVEKKCSRCYQIYDFILDPNIDTGCVHIFFTQEWLNFSSSGASPPNDNVQFLLFWYRSILITLRNKKKKPIQVMLHGHWPNWTSWKLLISSCCSHLHFNLKLHFKITLNNNKL